MKWLMFCGSVQNTQKFRRSLFISVTEVQNRGDGEEGVSDVCAMGLRWSARKLVEKTLPSCYLLSHSVGSVLKALVGRSAEEAVPGKVEHGSAETDERLGDGGRQQASVVVTWGRRSCTLSSRNVKCANTLAETHGSDGCFTPHLHAIQRWSIAI